MSLDYIHVTEELAIYISSVAPPEPDVLRRLREETANDPQSNMQIGAEQGRFMALLTRMLGVKRALEIGVFTGYSSLSVAMAMPDDGRLIACDRSEEWTSVARRYWREAGVGHKIDLRLGPAIETLDGLIAGGAAGTFDFVFIDADKENYSNYFERALTLLRPAGLIAVDNVLWHGRVVDAGDESTDTVAIREFNEKMREDQRVDACLIPVGDGLTLAWKKP